MAKKFKFRKMYFHCTDGKVIEENVEMTWAYRKRETAQSTLKTSPTHMMWEDKKKPIPKKSVEGFYLVHESLFEKEVSQEKLK